MVEWHRCHNGHEFERVKIAKDREAWRAAVHGVTKSWTQCLNNNIPAKWVKFNCTFFLNVAWLQLIILVGDMSVFDEKPIYCHARFYPWLDQPHRLSEDIETITQGALQRFRLPGPQAQIHLLCRQVGSVTCMFLKVAWDWSLWHFTLRSIAPDGDSSVIISGYF